MKITIQNGIKTFNLIKPYNIIDEVLGILEKHLPDFASSTTYEKLMVVKKNETHHTTALCVFMMKNQDKLTFMPEVYQKGASKIDIGIYDKATDNLIFTIEAKVLPTPRGTKTKPRAQSEYVYSLDGQGGAGIQRFKKGMHGLDSNDKPLSSSAMIAYIKENDFKYWLDQTNKWITEANWDSKEHLSEIYLSPIGKLTSLHKREDSSELNLFHFWLKLS